MARRFNIHEGMPIVGSCDGYVGRVDKVEGKAIRLAHENGETGLLYHFLPSSWVESAGLVVRLNRPRREVIRTWETAEVFPPG
jgi:hypothetical protein